MRNLISPIIGLFFSALIVASCSKPPKENKLKIQNPTSYVLKKQTGGYPSNGSTFAYFYKSDHLVSRIERYEWANGVNDTTYSTFEYENGLCRKWTLYDGYARAFAYGYFIYEYNDKNLAIKRTYFSDNNIEFYTFYKYDDADNLIEKIDSSQSVDFRDVYFYDGDNNLVKAIDYILWSSPQQKSQIEWSDFDQKVNFIKSVNGLPLTAAYDNNYGSYSSSSPNNYHVESSYTQIDIDQPFGQPYSSYFQYEYNEEDLPLKLFNDPWITSFEYEKYK